MTVDLHLAFGPLPSHELAFVIEVLAHVVELLNHRFHALAEFGPGEIAIDLLHLRLLPLLRQPRTVELDQHLPEGKPMEAAIASVSRSLGEASRTLGRNEWKRSST